MSGRLKTSLGAVFSDFSAVGLARMALILLFVAQPFPHNVAVKNLALLGLVVAIGRLAAGRQLQVDWRSPNLRAIGGMLLVLLVTSLLGVDPLDSLDELRKQFLPAVLILLALPVVCRDALWRRRMLLLIAGAFTVRAGLTLGELMIYFPDLDTGRNEGWFIKGFSLDASLYVPALLGLGLLDGRARWLALSGLLLVLVTMVTTQSRAPMLAAMVCVLAMLCVLQRWRLLLLLTLAALAASAMLVVKQPQLADRFASIFEPATYTRAFDTRHYVPAEGFAARLPIWAGVIEITSGRSLTGYGFGWKKLAEVAVEGGYVARWADRADDPFAAEQASYFALPSGKVNPHNLYLQIYFESGWLGLVAYLLLLAFLIRSAFRLAWRASEIEHRILAAVLLGYLAGHVVLGLADGLWMGLGPSLAFVALLESVRRSENRV